MIWATLHVGCKSMMHTRLSSGNEFKLTKTIFSQGVIMLNNSERNANSDVSLLQ